VPLAEGPTDGGIPTAVGPRSGSTGSLIVSLFTTMKNAAAGKAHSDFAHALAVPEDADP